MTKTHPALIYYRATLERDHRLILILGREPNDEAEVVMEVGPYDFDGLSLEARKEARRCNFWHASYLIAGRLHDPSDQARGTAWLKDHARRIGSSPILIADAIPQGQLNAVRNKNERRTELRDRLSGHVKAVFALDERLTKRIGLVLLAGWNLAGFAPATDAARAECARRGIPCYATPFMSTRMARQFFRDDVNARKSHKSDEKRLDGCLPDACVITGREIIAEFLDHGPKLAV